MKIVIADDDKIIRKGLKAIIENNMEGYTVVGEASNGRDALALIEETIPDLLITDIKMPVMDGIDLVRNIEELSLKVKIIVLSGFSEFKYVRTTMKAGAADYLLKPVENEELIELIRKINGDIKNDKKREDNLNKSDLILHEKYLSDLIAGNGTYSGKDISMEPPYSLYVISIDDREPQNIDMFKKEIEKRYKSNSIWTIEDSDLVLLCGDHSADSAVPFDWLPASITVGAAGPYDSLNETPRVYRQALEACRRGFFEGRGTVIEFSDKWQYSRITWVAIQGSEKKLQSCFDVGDAYGVKKAVLLIIDKLVSLNCSPRDFRNSMLKVVNKLYLLYPEVRPLESADTLEKTILGVETLPLFKRNVSNTFYEMTIAFSALEKERCIRVIEQAKEYIDSHFSDDISLDRVAEHVYMNPNYLSELFKSETGKNYLEYVLDMRIDTAKVLLKDQTLKVYEVGYKVGYNEPVSFNRAFKRIVGVTPSEYRKK